MKKATFLLAMTMMLWLCPGTAEAQLSYGVKGGLNLTSMKLNNELLKASNRTGFFVGPTVRLKTGKFISFMSADLTRIPAASSIFSVKL